MNGKILRKIFSHKTYTWLFIVLGMVVLAVYFYARTSGKAGVKSEAYSMVKYVEQVNEEVFLNVGIQQVKTITDDTKIPGLDISLPLTKKKALIILNYDAKLGIKRPVKIEQVGKNKYKITIPKYEVVGISLDRKQPYKLYDRSGELLSFSTKEIDTGEEVAQTLSDEEQNKYLEEYKSQMNSSAEIMYKRLFKAINPDIKLTFVFGG